MNEGEDIFDKQYLKGGPNPENVPAIRGTAAAAYPPLRDGGPGGDPYILVRLAEDMHSDPDGRKSLWAALDPDVAAVLHVQLSLAAERGGYRARFDRMAKLVMRAEREFVRSLPPERRAVYEAGGQWEPAE